MEAATPGLSYAECVDRLQAAREALEVMPSVTWQASGGELAEGLEVLGEVSALGEGAEVAVTMDAFQRGEPAAGSPPVSPREWVMAHHRRYAAAGASGLVEVAQAALDRRFHVLRDALTSGRVSVATARVAMKEMRALAPYLNPDAVDTVWEGLMALGERHDARTVRKLRERLLAAHGLEDAFEDTDDKARVGASLSTGREIAPGLWEYLLRTTREGRAAIEAAIGTLSAPVPGPDGERDERPHDQRRAEALVAVLERAMKAGTSTWSSTKAQIFVQIGLDDLTRAAGAGSLLGGLNTGELVSAETVRKWACDASVIPTCLDSDGEVVDLGVSERFFQPGQIKRLWLRDRHCTFPGCDAPASWCDAHHLVHWVDGGPTDVDSGALLCGRHHTIVHTQRYHGWLDRSGTHPAVRWDLTRGSYDDFLTGLRPPGQRLADLGPDTVAEPSAASTPWTAAPRDTDPAEPPPDIWHPPRRVSGDDTYWPRE